MNRIASYLKGKFDDDKKFRWYVKKKDFRLMDVPELSLRDVLVVPVKEDKKVRFVTTILLPYVGHAS